MPNARLLPLTTAAVLTGSLVALSGGGVSAAPQPAFNTTWTVDSTANSISEYAVDAHGNATPLATISGLDTKLAGPSAIVLGPQGSILVTNKLSNTITEYAAGSSGDAKPTATIGGPRTGLDGPTSIALAQGLIWVTDPTDNALEAFSADSRGNVLPAQTIAGHKTHLNHPIALTTSDTFPALTVLNAPTTGGGDLVQFDLEQVGDQAPLDLIKGTKKAPFKNPTAITQRDEFSVWVADAGTNSATDYLALPLPGLGSQVLQRIAGSATGIKQPVAITHDAFGRILIGNSGDSTIRVFGAEAHGNTAPNRTISGVGSALSQPAAVSDYGTVPAEPTNVRAVRHGRKVHLTWDPPAVTGGAVLGYVVEETQETGDDFSGLAQLIASLTSGGDGTATTKTSVTRKIKPGVRYDFNIIAVNGYGEGAASTTVHAAIVRRPGPPTDLSVEVHGRQLLALWDDPIHTGGAAHLHYRFEYTTCDFSSSDCAFKTQKSKEPLAFVGGLKKHTTYHARVIAVDKAGAGAPSKVRTVKVKG